MISTVPSIKSQNSRASTRILENQKTRSGIGMLEGEDRSEDLRARPQVLRNSLQGSDGRPASQLHLPDPYPNPRQQKLPGAPRQGQGPKPYPSHRPPSEGRRRGRRRLRTGKTAKTGLNSATLLYSEPGGRKKFSPNFVKNKEKKKFSDQVPST